jgi:2-amino-4-hydroxy-6-hydroxymethyldihydropteridine diphosphokinase
MSAHFAVIAFGSNLGDRVATMESARTALDAHPKVQLVTMSSLYETAALKPDGVDTSAPAYLNAVALISTTLTPEELLTELMRIERENGRERHERWGDRTLDLDIVDFEGVTSATEELILPHPRAHERLFVLEPWLEVQPEAHIAGVPIRRLMEQLQASIQAEATR